MGRQGYASASSRPEAAPVSWRDGVHITGTPIWCDARREREVCFVSSADAVPASRHGQLVGTDATLRLLARSERKSQPQSQLAVPYGRPFTLGTRRIELFRSGHALGAASLAVDVDGERVVYAGSVNPRGGGLGGEADLRTCHTLVLAAAYGDPRFSFPPVDDMAADVTEFCRRVAARGGAAVLLVTSSTKGLDVAARLAKAELRLIAHRAIHHAARRLEAGGISAPRLRRFGGRVRGGDVLLWLVRARDALARAELPNESRLALVSGAALEPGADRALGVETAFPWSNQADHQALLEYVEATGAERLFFTHRYAEAMARSLDGSARSARPLGPPEQMSLF